MILEDKFGRQHTYLRISITERCNFRCTYCMPVEGILLSPKSHIMTKEEIFEIAKVFVDNGVTKIRLTGGEPLVRKDFLEIIEQLSTLPVELAISSNGVLLDKYLDDFKRLNIRKLNISLDTLNKEQFKQITRRDEYERVFKNIKRCIEEGFQVKLNYVAKKEDNLTEIIDFIELTRDWPVEVRFIEFMPFDGNTWDKNQLISLRDILNIAEGEYGKENLEKTVDEKNDTTKHYRIKDFKGEFGVISTVTKPFCDSCNRLRLTANGQLKNCLFSEQENDLLTQFRAGKDITSVISTAVKLKAKIRGGMDSQEKFENPDLNQNNRTMIQIGG